MHQQQQSQRRWEPFRFAFSERRRGRRRGRGRRRRRRRRVEEERKGGREGGRTVRLWERGKLLALERLRLVQRQRWRRVRASRSPPSLPPSLFLWNDLSALYQPLSRSRTLTPVSSLPPSLPQERNRGPDCVPSLLRGNQQPAPVRPASHHQHQEAAAAAAGAAAAPPPTSAKGAAAAAAAAAAGGAAAATGGTRPCSPRG